MFEPKEITFDGQKVMISTEKPVPTLPGMLGDPLFIIIDVTVTDRDYAKDGPICTGPYKVNSYTKALAKMDRNELYWDGEVPFAHVEVHTVDDPNTRAMALQAGEIDMAINIAPGDLGLFADKSKFYISAIPSLRDVLGRLNVAAGRPLADKRVREALISALDRETYCKVLLKDTFTAGGPLIPPSMNYGFADFKDPNAYDPDRAEKLLAEAGWKDTNGDGFVDKDGKNLEIDFIFYSGRAELPLFAEATQSDAANVGIKVNLKNVDYNVIDGIGVRGEYDILISNVLAAQAGDPEVFVNMYWKTNKYDKDPATGTNPQNGSGYSNAKYDELSEQLSTEFDPATGTNPQNGAGYSNPKYDELSEKLSTEFDPAKRREIVIEMQKIILDDAATVVFGYPQTNMISNLSVKNAEIKPCDYYWLTKEIAPVD